MALLTPENDKANRSKQEKQTNRNKSVKSNRKKIETKNSRKLLNYPQNKRKSTQNTIEKIATMATYYPHYQMVPQTYNYPVIVTEWSPLVTTVSSPVYTTPMTMPVAIINPTQIIAQLYPYTTLVTDRVLTSTIATSIPDEILALSNIYNPLICYSPDLPVNSPTDINDKYYTAESPPEAVNIDPLEFYLTLPRELFPTARMLALDPNPIIDEFCKLTNVNDNAPWILDLEFGIPRAPVTRAIPIYDVQFNSINCKNTPSAIHPGFESCSHDFKKIFLFYYDCVISTWYKGYIIMNYDKSVQNFQSWLLLPMQVFGMCWP